MSSFGLATDEEQETGMKKYGTEFIVTFWLAPFLGGLPGATVCRFIGGTEN